MVNGLSIGASGHGCWVMWLEEELGQIMKGFVCHVRIPGASCKGCGDSLKAFKHRVIASDLLVYLRKLTLAGRLDLGDQEGVEI